LPGVYADKFDDTSVIHKGGDELDDTGIDHESDIISGYTTPEDYLTDEDGFSERWPSRKSIVIDASTEDEHEDEDADPPQDPYVWFLNGFDPPRGYQFKAGELAIWTDRRDRARARLLDSELVASHR
jgi:hypothetical protein